MTKSTWVPIVLAVLTAAASADDLPDAWVLAQAKQRAEAVAAAEKAHGVTSRKTVPARLALAETEVLLGNVEKARTMYLETLKITSQAMKDVGKGYKRDLGMQVAVLNGVARTLMLEGRYPEAETVYQEALRFAQISLPETDERVLAARTGQSIAIARRFPIPQQEDLLKQVLKSARKAYGKSHPQVALVLDEFVIMNVLNEDLKRAIKVCKETIRIRRHTLGEFHPALAISLNRLASLYHDQKNYSKALEPLQEALRIRRKAFGETHPSVVKSLRNLARVYRDLGDAPQAAALEAEAKAIEDE